MLSFSKHNTDWGPPQTRTKEIHPEFYIILKCCIVKYSVDHLVTKSKLAQLTTRRASKLGDEVLRQGIAALFRKLADQEDGGPGSPENHLIGFWMPVSFIEQTGRGGEEVK